MATMNKLLTLASCSLAITLITACDGPEEQSPEAPKSQPDVAPESDVEVNQPSTYLKLVADSIANQDEIRAQLKHHPVFADASVPSIVDIKSPLTGEVLAHEVKVTRDGQDAGFAIVALKDGKLRMHSYGVEGATITENMLAEVPADQEQGLEIFQQGLFSYVAIDKDSGDVVSSSAREVPTKEQWSNYVISTQSRGYANGQDVESWDLVYGPPGPESGGGQDPEAMPGGVLPPGCENRVRTFNTYVAGDRDTPLWGQFKTNHYGGYCSVGCGPVAYAIYLAWAEKEWTGVNIFKGDSYGEIPNDDNASGDIVKSIGEHFDTFCIAGQGATPYFPNRSKFRRNVNKMLEDVNRGSYRMEGEVFFASSSHPELVRGNVLNEVLPKSKGGNNRPAIVFGWPPDHDDDAGIIEDIENQHIYLVDALREFTYIPENCGSTYIDAMRVNLGWGQTSNPRRWFGTWMVDRNGKAVGRIRRYKN